jgi:hypothetical protein
MPVTHELRLRVRELGVAALQRIDDFGMDDRRESAFAILLAGASPLAGLLLLGWEPATVVLALFLNLLLTLVEDWLKILRSLNRLPEVRRERVEDEFVWPVARALALGRRTVNAKNLPSEQQIAQGRTEFPLWFPTLFAFVTVGLASMLLLGDGSVYAHSERVAYGIAPNVILALVMSAFHRYNHHPHWRRAASVRLQTAAHTACMIAAVGTGTLLDLTPRRGPMLDETTLAQLSCALVLVYGAWRVWRLLSLRDAARWLRQSIRQMGAVRPEEAHEAGAAAEGPVGSRPFARQRRTLVK